MPPGCIGARRPENRVTARSGAPQKKCTGLHLAYESGAKYLEDAVGLHQRTPESIDVLGVVGSVLFIVIEADRIFDFIRKRMNAQSNVELFNSFISRA